VTAAQLAAETEWMRDKFAADRLAEELGCEVNPNLEFVGVVEPRDLVPGLWLLVGTPLFHYAEADAAGAGTSGSHRRPRPPARLGCDGVRP
jgi:hypothetical protein